MKLFLCPHNDQGFIKIEAGSMSSQLLLTAMLVLLAYYKMSDGKYNNEGKNNVLSANKQSNKLHTTVSVAFSYLLQCKVKTGGKLFLFIL